MTIATGGKSGATGSNGREIVCEPRIQLVDCARQVLRFALVYQREAEQVFDGLTEDHFLDDVDRSIYRALSELRERDRPWDITTLLVKLSESDGYPDVTRVSELQDTTKVPPISFGPQCRDTLKRVYGELLFREKLYRINVEFEGANDNQKLLQELQIAIDDVRELAVGTGYRFDKVRLDAAEDLGVPCVFQDLLPAGIPAFLGGASGVGKTLLIVALIYTATTGRTIFPSIKVDAPMRVIALLAENNTRSLKRRLRDLANLHELDLNAINESLERNARLRLLHAMPLMELDAKGNPCASAYYQWLKREIARFKPALIVVDTFARHYGLPDENSNPIVTQWMNQIQVLCEINGATVLILDHLSKVASGAKTSEQVDLRGAGAKVDAARWSAVVRRLSDDDAKRFEIVNPEQYMRLDVVNCNALAPHEPVFFHRVNGAYQEVSLMPGRMDRLANQMAVYCREKKKRIPYEVLHGKNTIADAKAFFDWLDERPTRKDLHAATDYGIENGLLTVEEDAEGRGRKRKWINWRSQKP